MTKFGCIVATGILDAGGRFGLSPLCISTASQDMFAQRFSCVTTVHTGMQCALHQLHVPDPPSYHNWCVPTILVHQVQLLQGGGGFE